MPVFHLGTQKHLQNMPCGKTHCDGAKIHLTGRRFSTLTRTWSFRSPILKEEFCYDIKHFAFFHWKVCLFLGCTGKTKTHKKLLQYNLHSNYKIKWIPKPVWDKAAESLVTSPNRLHASHRWFPIIWLTDIWSLEKPSTIIFTSHKKR
jgi:hypothetical protein